MLRITFCCLDLRSPCSLITFIFAESRCRFSFLLGLPVALDMFAPSLPWNVLYPKSTSSAAFLAPTPPHVHLLPVVALSSHFLLFYLFFPKKFLHLPACTTSYINQIFGLKKNTEKDSGFPASNKSYARVSHCTCHPKRAM